MKEYHFEILDVRFNEDLKKINELASDGWIVKFIQQVSNVTVLMFLERDKK